MMYSRDIKLTPDEIREKFYKLKTLSDLAELLDVPKKTLGFYTYTPFPRRHYKEFQIPKKNGESRRILAPSSPIKIVQRKMAQVFYAVYYHKSTVHGFLPERSILTNARRHVPSEKKRKKFVFNADLEDFFPSITRRRVSGLLRSKPYKLPSNLANAIASLCCFFDELPQGAPSSPIITNMICSRMDTELRRLATSTRCMYTRYADDITFSTNMPRFPEAIAKVDEETGQLLPGDRFKEIVENNRFVLNEKKLRLQTRTKRQEITGLTVNEFPNVRRNFVRQIRAMLHALETYGLQAAESEFKAKYSENKSKSFLKVLRGKLAYLKMVRGSTNNNYIAFKRKLDLFDPTNTNTIAIDPKNTTEIYIVSEGKTDWQHIKTALGEFHGRREFLDLNVQFFEYGNEQKMSDSVLLKRCKMAETEQPGKITISIFDRDAPEIIKEVSTEKGENYKKWATRHFSFVLPTPPHREGVPVCTELYYYDADLMKEDPNGWRIFLSSEFDRDSQRHKERSDLSAKDINKFQTESVKIIDDKVFNGQSQNVALSKSRFAEYVYNKDGIFGKMDFSEFQLIFRMVRRIVKENKSSLQSS